jgi:hypothetical protein
VHQLEGAEVVLEAVPDQDRVRVDEAHHVVLGRIKKNPSKFGRKNFIIILDKFLHRKKDIKMVNALGFLVL